MSTNQKKPVTSIKYQKEYDGTPGFSRVSIPDSSHQGEEEMAIDGMPEKSRYDVFRHSFKRGMDPELYWLDKYKNDDANSDDLPQLETDIRSLYAHEDVRPEAIIEKMYEIHEEESNEPGLFEDFFADDDEQQDELERLAGYYKHEDNWRNRLILGDSLLVMNSLLNREGMKGQIQCVYIDPPYGIKYGSNWQMKINNQNMKDSDQNMSGEPEMIKAYRDTWELGIHSYLSYLRDRLVLSRELLSESGSCFVQISDDNVHLVRSLMDEVFGSENFVSQIIYTKTSGFSTSTIGSVADYILWYAKDINSIKIRKLFVDHSAEEDPYYNQIELSNGERMSIVQWEKINQQKFNYNNPPEGSKIYMSASLVSSGNASQPQPFEFEGKVFYPGRDSHWKANYPAGMNRLKERGRLFSATGDNLRYVRYIDDFPYIEISNLWTDTSIL